MFYTYLYVLQKLLYTFDIRLLLTQRLYETLKTKEDCHYASLSWKYTFTCTLWAYINESKWTTTDGNFVEKTEQYIMAQYGYNIWSKHLKIINTPFMKQFSKILYRAHPEETLHICKTKAVLLKKPFLLLKCCQRMCSEFPHLSKRWLRIAAILCCDILSKCMQSQELFANDAQSLENKSQKFSSIIIGSL